MRASGLGTSTRSRPLGDAAALDRLVFVDPETGFDTIWKVLPEYWGDAPHPTLTGIGVTWLYGFQFEIKVIAKLPEASD